MDQAGKRKDELLWPIFRLHHQRSRYIFDMYYTKKAITKEVYEFALREKYADQNLIAKWKKVRGTRARTREGMRETARGGKAGGGARS